LECLPEHLLRRGARCVEPPARCGPGVVIVAREVPEGAPRECVYYLGSWGGEGGEEG